MEYKYCVYMHINKINNKKYIGITRKCPEERWKNGKGYVNSKVFFNAILKYGWENFEHIIIAIDISQEEAERIEKQLIKEYRTNNNKYGYNIESGGLKQKEIPKSTRIKLSQNNGRFWLGKTLPQETRDKISIKKKGKKYGNAILKSRAVDQYDLNGNYIATYPTMTQAMKETGVLYQNISMCCRGIVHKTHNYIFRFSKNQ